MMHLPNHTQASIQLVRRPNMRRLGVLGLGLCLTTACGAQGGFERATEEPQRLALEVDADGQVNLEGAEALDAQAQSLCLTGREVSTQRRRGVIAGEHLQLLVAQEPREELIVDVTAAPGTTLWCPSTATEAATLGGAACTLRRRGPGLSHLVFAPMLAVSEDDRAALDEAFSKVEAGSEEASEAIADQAKEGENGLAAAGAALADQSQAACGAVQEGALDAQDTAKGVLETAKDGLSSAVDSVKETANAAAETFGGAGHSAIEWAKEWGAQLGNGTQESLGWTEDMANRAQEAAGEVANQTAEGVTQAKDVASKTLGAAADSASEAQGSVLEGAGSVLEDAGSAANTTQNLAEQAKEEL